MKRSGKKLRRLFAGSPIGTLLNVLYAGKIQASPTEQIAPEEVQIGKMNKAEKILWSAAVGLREEMKSILCVRENLGKETKRKGRKWQLFLNDTQCGATASLLRDIQGVMWHLIMQRLGFSTRKRGRLGIRAGYTIVSLPESDRQRVDPSAMVARLIASMR